MKKLLIVISALFLANHSLAQWVSPGNGQSYTLESLCSVGCAGHLSGVLCDFTKFNLIRS